jgi:transcription regulator MmyB-like protein
VNTARFVFLNPRAPDFYQDWEGSAAGCAAVLRSEAGPDPHDRDRIAPAAKGRFTTGPDFNDLGPSRRHLHRALGASLRRQRRRDHRPLPAARLGPSQRRRGASMVRRA